MKHPLWSLVATIAIVALLSLTIVSCQQPEINGPQQVQVGAAPLAKVDATTRLFLLQVAPHDNWEIAVAPDGARIRVTGAGSFQPVSKSIEGKGGFEITSSTGVQVSYGIWTATDLISFVSYGTGTPPPTLPNVEGGKAIIRIHLAPTNGGGESDAILQVHSLYGNPPAGADEGVRVALEGGPNFNQEVSGQPFFIKEQ